MTDIEFLILRALERILHNQVHLDSIETHEVAFAIESALAQSKRDEGYALK
jgi:hypothetical protein